jgi:hypothetical protein
MVLIDDPRGDKTTGGVAAAPVFKEIMERIYYSPRVSPRNHNLAQTEAKPVCDDVSFVSLSRSDAERRAMAMESCHLSFSGQGSHVIAQRFATDERHHLALTLGEYRRSEMPDVRGLSLRDALDILKETGAQVNVSGSGWVIRQEPAPATPLKREERFRLVLGEKS